MYIHSVLWSILSSNAKNRRLSLLAAIKSTIEGPIYGGVLSVAELGRNIYGGHFLLLD